MTTSRDLRQQLAAIGVVAGVFLGGGAIYNAFSRAPSASLDTRVMENAPATLMETVPDSVIRDPLVYDKQQTISPQQIAPQDYRTTDFSTDSDEVLLARMIFGEARGCSEIERIAVGYTALNRVNDGKKWNGETIREVILKPKQYSCFNESDPNRAKLMNPMSYEPKVFEDCLDIARNILNGECSDPAKGATHYFNPRYANPSWANRMNHIGYLDLGEDKKSEHKFFKED